MKLIPYLIIGQSMIQLMIGFGNPAILLFALFTGLILLVLQ